MGSARTSETFPPITEQHGFGHFCAEDTSNSREHGQNRVITEPTSELLEDVPLQPDIESERADPHLTEEPKEILDVPKLILAQTHTAPGQIESRAPEQSSDDLRCGHAHEEASHASSRSTSSAQNWRARGGRARQGPSQAHKLPPKHCNTESTPTQRQKTSRP